MMLSDSAADARDVSVEHVWQQTSSQVELHSTVAAQSLTYLQLNIYFCFSLAFCSFYTNLTTVIESRSRNLE